MGVDVFIYWDDGERNPDVIGKSLEAHQPASLPLKMITNRGTKVYPGGIPETFSTDHWRCRFVGTEGTIQHGEVINLLRTLNDAGFEVIKTEYLYKQDEARMYSLGQGE